MKKIISVITLCLFFAGNIYGQTLTAELPKVIPTSPNVASLEKFGSYPVSHSTGTVNISVDLYSIPLGKGVNLPIQLNYHSSGIKVDEICGWVGAGWALSAGGCISREIRGIKDESPTSGFYKYSKANKGHKYPYPIKMPDDYELLKSVATGTDGEPDIFSYNINGRSGRFFIDNYGEFQTIPYSNIKIVKHPLDNTSAYGIWEMIDESGIRYIFREPESTDVSGKPYPTAWWLEKIISSEGNVLAAFEYIIDYQIAKGRIPQSIKFAISHTSYFQVADIPDYLKDNISSEHPEFTARIISKINIPGKGYLTFQANESRQDITGKKLTQIESYDAQNNFQTGYTLKYTQENTRPFLSEIKKTDNISTISYRKFTYYPGLSSPVSSSTSQDLWGYYNGANNGNTLFPFIYGLRESLSGYPFSNIGYYQFATNRYPSTKAVCGSIKEVVYPTGGFTSFEFENNRVRTSEQMTNITQQYGQLSQKAFGQITSTEFEVATAPLTGTMSISKHSAGIYDTEIILWDVTQNKQYASYSTTEGGRTPSYTDINNGIIRYTFPISMEKIVPGKYKWIIKIITDVPTKVTPDPASVSYSYFKAEVSTVNEKMVGGIRIAKITNYDKDKSILSQTKYRYIESDGLSSGIPSPDPMFVKDYAVGICVGTTMIYGSLNIRELFDTNINNYSGEPVQYSSVTEEVIKGANDIIKTEYSYSIRDFKKENQLPNVPSFVCMPVPFTSNEYKGGLLLTKTEYKSSNGVFSKVRKETNNYTINEDAPKFKPLFVYTYFKEINCKTTTEANYYAGRYDLISAKVYLNKKTIEETSETGAVSTTVTDYVYGNSTYLQPTSTVQYDSQNRKFETLNKYCYDVTSVVSDSMKVKNMISQPVQIIKKVNNVQSQQMQYNFGHFNTNKITELKSVLVQNGASDLYGFEYLNYDSYGNPIYLVKDVITKIIYLWGYSGQYPIAEIKNATYDQVKAALGGATPESLSSADTPNATLINGLRTNANLIDALVATYTYKPLVGMLTATDPRGVTTYYDYDSFGRLKETYIIENTLKKVIQVNNYHYQNQ
ncbi:hypothetical protein [Dysgonomonas sp. GY617]|uniref:hypothetical protein n=1 Tax=Dysgonomonas sp. GY617 TaxID=2780420 RepID=UPI001883ED3A|nr:hypothetical protein [Dysgonomonas sp. GY617]MBF0576009.1 hypothetical protein [Dysgonomonas sp. GY617]